MMVLFGETFQCITLTEVVDRASMATLDVNIRTTRNSRRCQWFYGSSVGSMKENKVVFVFIFYL